MTLFISATLLALSAIFYAAGERQLGVLGNTVCNLGPALCAHPSWLMVAGLVVLVWAFFLRVDTL